MFFIESHIDKIQDKTIEKIESFRELLEGWDYGIGKPASENLVEFAIELYQGFKNHGLQADATPRTDGGITLIFYKGDHFIDVIINIDYTLSLRKEVGIGADYSVEFEEENVSIKRINNILTEIYWQCSSLEPSISKSMFPVSEDFKVTALVYTEAEFQYSTNNVPYNYQDQYAYTY